MALSRDHFLLAFFLYIILLTTHSQSNRMPRKPVYKPAYPKINEIKEIMKKSQKGVYYDPEGRLYGFMKDDALERDETNEEDKIMWVGLLQRKKGLYNARTKNEPSTESEELLFPKEGETIDLYDRVTREPYGQVMVTSFPEWNQHGNQRSTSIFVSVQSWKRGVDL